MCERLCAWVVVCALANTQRCMCERLCVHGWLYVLSPTRTGVCRCEPESECGWGVPHDLRANGAFVCAWVVVCAVQEEAQVHV